jgi:hypothetical protein
MTRREVKLVAPKFCFGPRYLAQDFVRIEGYTRVEHLGLAQGSG